MITLKIKENPKHVHVRVYTGAYNGRLTFTHEEYAIFKAMLKHGEWKMDTKLNITKDE